MADVTVPRDGWCPELDLEPNVITTVTFADEDLQSVEVVVVANTAPVRWTCDGSEPTEDTGYYIPRDGVDERPVNHDAADAQGGTVVKLWTSGTATACVQRG